MAADLDPRTLANTVVWGGLAIGLALGAVGQATRFCVRGAFGDWVGFGAPGRMVAWLLAIATGAVAVQALASAGLFDAGRTIYWSDRFPWPSYLVGGALFGYGMILAGGCPQRCLVKTGQGDMKAAVVLVVVAIVSLMTLRGLFAPVRVNGLDAFGFTLAGPQDAGGWLARVIGLSPNAMRWSITAALASAVFVFAWRMRARIETGHWLGGIIVGLLVGTAFWLTGHVGFLPEHPETLEPAWLGTQSKRPEALDLLTFWSDKATVATFGVTLSLGVLVGAFVTARLRKDFRLESFRGPQDLGQHVLGGVLMGFGGITALGCSLGNGVTGIAMLSVGAMLATLGITAGAWFALVRQLKAAHVDVTTTNAAAVVEVGG